jgi:hypothetical protein
MTDERERSVRLREEWLAMLFVGLIIVAVIGAGILLVFGT